MAGTSGGNDPWGSRCRSRKNGRFISKRVCQIRMDHARRRR